MTIVAIIALAAWAITALMLLVEMGQHQQTLKMWEADNRFFTNTIEEITGRDFTHDTATKK
jgi:L-asparagine transporter-like permease